MHACFTQKVKIFWKFMFSYWVSQSTPTLRLGLQGMIFLLLRRLATAQPCAGWMDGRLVMRECVFPF